MIKSKVIETQQPTFQSHIVNKSRKKNKITYIAKDSTLFEKAFTNPPTEPERSGDMRYPGVNGLWGEWVASQKRWTERRFYVSAIRGFPRTERMSFAKAWAIRCLRMGLIVEL